VPERVETRGEAPTLEVAEATNKELLPCGT
jgi:hypothetical protein